MENEKCSTKEMCANFNQLRTRIQVLRKKAEEVSTSTEQHIDILVGEEGIPVNAAERQVSPDGCCSSSASIMNDYKASLEGINQCLDIIQKNLDRL